MRIRREWEEGRGGDAKEIDERTVPALQGARLDFVERGVEMTDARFEELLAQLQDETEVAVEFEFPEWRDMVNAARAALVAFAENRETEHARRSEFCDCPNCPAYGSYVRALTDRMKEGSR